MSSTRMYLCSLTLLLCSSLSLCHDSNIELLEKVEEDIAAIREGHETIKLGTQGLQDYFLNEIDQFTSSETSEEAKKEDEPKDPVSYLKVKNFIHRLNKLEKNIEAIESYVRDEKETDTFLSGLRGDIGKAFDNDMLKVKNLAGKMREELTGSLVNVDHDLRAVEDFANSRNVIIGGVLYYDGIGTACGHSFDVCRVEKSECRDEKCQCEPGLSYDGLQEECVEICTYGYGSTYQTVQNYIIRDYNNATMNETSLEKCKELCETEDSFECRSFDYFPLWNACYLSESVKADVEEDSWEYNSAGIHFQRDCIVAQ